MNRRNSEEDTDRRVELMSGSVGDPRIELSIERKRRLTSSLGFQFNEEMGPRSLFEHFMIVGVPPDNDNDNDKEKKVEPQILFLYPSTPLLFTEDDFNQTVHFCFPNGIRPHELEYKRQNIFISEFAFRLNGSSTSIYGVCVHFIANPRRTPFFATEKTLKYPFCFCLLTKDPILSVHFQYLTYMALLYCRVLNPVIERKNIFPDIPEGVSLSNLEQEKGTARWRGTRYPDILHQELHFFKSMRASRDRDTKQVLAEGMRLVIPPTQSDIRSIAMPTLDVLFSCLTVNDIVTLFSALLLEHHTIFKSKRLDLLTMSVLAARTLLSPFKIGATLLPIVPNIPSFLQLLQSPVPYIFGIITTNSLSSISLPDDICIVDLDEGKISDPMLKVTLPRQTELVNTIEKSIKMSQMIVLPPPFIGPKAKHQPNKEFSDFIELIHSYMRPTAYIKKSLPKYVFNPPLVEEIMQSFSRHIAPELENTIKPCFVTDSTDCQHPVTVFNLDLFLASVKPEEEEFYREFCGTSIFQQFCDGKTDEMDINKRNFIDSNSIQSTPPSFLLSDEYV